MDKDSKILSTLLHVFGVIPMGVVATFVIWHLKKEEFPAIDSHGKKAMNFQLTFLIITFLLVPVFGIGILVYAMRLIFSLLAATKAYQQEAYEYPLAFKFFKE